MEELKSQANLKSSNSIGLCFILIVKNLIISSLLLVHYLFIEYLFYQNKTNLIQSIHLRHGSKSAP